MYVIIYNIFKLTNTSFTPKSKTQELMNPVKGWYDKETDSIVIQVHFTASEPQGVK
jgi:hypothetical protein